MELLKEHDPNPARSETTSHGIDKLMKVYKEMFDATKCLVEQTTMSSFFKELPPPPSISANPFTPTSLAPSSSFLDVDDDDEWWILVTQDIP